MSRGIELKNAFATAYTTARKQEQAAMNLTDELHKEILRELGINVDRSSPPVGNKARLLDGNHVVNDDGHVLLYLTAGMNVPYMELGIANNHTATVRINFAIGAFYEPKNGLWFAYVDGDEENFQMSGAVDMRSMRELLVNRAWSSKIGGRSASYIDAVRAG